MIVSTREFVVNPVIKLDGLVLRPKNSAAARPNRGFNCNMTIDFNTEQKAVYRMPTDRDEKENADQKPDNRCSAFLDDVKP